MPCIKVKRNDIKTNQIDNGNYKGSIKVYKGKMRQCPKCKSKKGFELRYSIGGYGSVEMNFKGLTINSEREQFDTLDHYANCLNCGFSIDTDRLQTD